MRDIEEIVDMLHKIALIGKEPHISVKKLSSSLWEAKHVGALINKVW
jgi:hypothetical protein